MQREKSFLYYHVMSWGDIEIEQPRAQINSQGE